MVMPRHISGLDSFVDHASHVIGPAHAHFSQVTPPVARTTNTAQLSPARNTRSTEP